MKTTIISLSILLSSFVFSSCNHTPSGEGEATSVEGNSAAADENAGNHANTPNTEPGTEYPGSAGDSTHMHDSVHSR